MSQEKFSKNLTQKGHSKNITDIFLDVDGVLVGREDVPIVMTQQLVEVLSDIKDDGITIHLCTGRGQGFTEALLKLLQLSMHGDVWHVIENGAIAWRTGIPRAHIFASTIDPQLKPLKHKQIQASLRNLEEEAQKIGLSQELEKHFSLSFNSEDADKLAQLYQKINDIIYDNALKDVLRVFLSPTAVDVIPAGVGKSIMVTQLLQEMGRTWENVLVIGDSKSDLRSLEEANKAGGISVCPANASDDIKAAAQVVTAREVLGGAIDYLTYFVKDRDSLSRKKKKK